MASARELQLRTLTLQQDGRVLTAGFAWPPHNFMTAEFAADWDALTRAVDRDPTVGAVVLTGAPEGRFLTHFDVAELAAVGRTAAPPMTPAVGSYLVWFGFTSLRIPGVRALWLKTGGALGRSLVTLHRLHFSIRRMHASRVVYVAAVNGPCLGGGLELALACDVRFAADSATVTFGQVEVLGGIIPGAGGTQHLPRLLGVAKALELVLDGTVIDADEAHRLGLVSALAPPEDLLAEAQRFAARLATRSPAALAAAKRAIYVGAALPLARGLYVEAGGLLTSGKSAEAARLSEVFAADLDRIGDTPFVRDPAGWYDGTR